MPTRTIRSVRLGYKYFWDISNPDRSSWLQFRAGDYSFQGTRQRQTGIKTGGGKGGRENTFNFQPQPTKKMAAYRGEDNNTALEYQRKRLFSWAVYHHGDSTASMFYTGWGDGRIPTEESTTTDGGGRGGPRSISREHGLRKFFWGMLRPDKNRPQIYSNRGDIYSNMQKTDPQSAGGAFVADTLRAEEGSLLGQYQRDILPKAVWRIKKLTEQRMLELSLKMKGFLGVFGAQATLDTMSEEELGIIIMEQIVQNLAMGMSGKEAVQTAARNPATERRYEAVGKQKVDIDPKYQPLAAEFLTKYFTKYAAVKGNFVEDLNQHRGGGYEVSMVENRLQAYYGKKKSDFSSTTQMAASIAESMRADIQTHLDRKLALGPAKGNGVGYGVAERARRDQTGNFRQIYTTQMGGDGIGIYMVAVINNVPAVIPYVWTGPKSTLIEKMILDLVKDKEQSEVMSALKAEQIGGFLHSQMGDVFIDNAETTKLQQINWLGQEGGVAGGRGGTIGGKYAGGMYVRAGVSMITADKLSKSIFNWVEAGAEVFGRIVDVQNNSKLRDFIEQSQMQAEVEVNRSEESAMGGWLDWVEKLGGNFTPVPQEAPSWSPFLHPRPYLTQDTRGQKTAAGALKGRTSTKQWNSFLQ
tara:strand:+ start:269 stop:2185 length:1917 start_codon:yes stop_codon:yes gene_type:complete